MVGKHTPSVAFDCTLCRKPTSAPIDSALALLAVCAACQAKRFAAGIKQQREAEAKS